MPEVDAAQLEGEAMLSDRIADLVEYLVVQIVDDPDSVSLEVIDGDDASTIEVSVAEDDVAKVIGRRGRTIKAIRTLARALAARLDTAVEVEVLGEDLEVPVQNHRPCGQAARKEGGGPRAAAAGASFCIDAGYARRLDAAGAQARPFLHGRIRHRYGRWRSGLV